MPKHYKVPPKMNPAFAGKPAKKATFPNMADKQQAAVVKKAKAKRGSA